MGKEKTAAKSIRLTVREWAELDYAAEMHGCTRNDEVRWRLAQRAVEMPGWVMLDEQTSIYDCLREDRR